MMIKFHEQFWYDSRIPESRVFERSPDVYSDNRGSFTEVLKHSVGMLYTDNWYSDLSWIKQINRSKSKPGVARGMHAQSGKSCQGKLVQAVYGKIFDIITDARPDSDTFGVSDVFELDSERQNQLWVPRGFLHGFVVPPGQNGMPVFEYFCDNEYDKKSEISIAPDGFIQKILQLKAEANPTFKTDIAKLELSEKDAKGIDYEKWMHEKCEEYEKEGKLWYK